MIAYKTRAEQTIEHLLSLKRPLEEDEQDALYKALHADYMRKWRAHRAAKYGCSVETTEERHNKLRRVQREFIQAMAA